MYISNLTTSFPAKIQQLKKAINKDKKKKKEVLEEINQMEMNLKQRHSDELKNHKEEEEEEEDKVG